MHSKSPYGTCICYGCRSEKFEQQRFEWSGARTSLFTAQDCSGVFAFLYYFMIELWFGLSKDLFSLCCNGEHYSLIPFCPNFAQQL